MEELVEAVRGNEPDAFRALLSERIRELGVTEVEELYLNLLPLLSPNNGLSQ